MILIDAEVLLFLWFGIGFFTSSPRSGHFAVFTKRVFMIL
jgi:hypothetical protein